MAEILYILTALTTMLCTVMLLRRYAVVRSKLLLWSGLCFAGLTVSNLFTFIDLVIYREIDLYTYRLGAAAVSMCLLLFGLIWESQ